MFTKRATSHFGRLIRTRCAARSLWYAALLACAFVSAAEVGAANAVPDKVTAADRQAIETTIRKQLEAFSSDDADRAYGFATPEIQKQTGSADRFMVMVRERYAPVYRAGSVFFARLTSVEGEWIQAVQLSGEDGRVWRAFFTMRRQPDRGWKVGGCQLVETSALST